MGRDEDSLSRSQPHLSHGQLVLEKLMELGKNLHKLISVDASSGINPHHLARVKKLLVVLWNAKTLNDIEATHCHRLHKNAGRYKRPTYAVNVSAQWRLVFEFEPSKGVTRVDYVNYH